MKFVFLQVLVIAVLHGDVLSVTTEKNNNEEEVALESVSSVSKRQTNFQNNNNNKLNQPQIPQEYFDFIQQENYDGNLVPEQPQFGQQNVQSVFVQGVPSNVFPPRTTTTQSPFTAEQVRFQQEYARRTLVAQQTAQLRPRPRPLAQPLPTQFQFQTSPIPEQQLRQQPQPLQFLDQNGQVRQQNFGLQQQNFAPQQQQQPEDLVPQQQDLTQQIAVPVSGDEPFSYAQVQFGPVAQQSEPVVSRPKGQRSVSRPSTNFAVEPATQQTIDYSVTAANPALISGRLLQNVVYIQPNGQIYKEVEETEPVVQIPRKNHHNYYQTVSAITSGPVTSASSTTPLTSSTTTAAPEEEPVILIPRPKKPNQRHRQDIRKPIRVQQQQQPQQLQQQQHQQQLHQQQQQQEQHIQHQQQQQSSEVEPDNFLTSLLSRFQQTQPAETTVATVPKARGSQRPKSGNRSGTSKYLPDRSQLQLLQFPHELKALSSAELKALEETSIQIAAANDKSVKQKQLLRNASVPPSPPAQLNERIVLGNRPVPTPVELNEEQRQFLAAQGIRHLYRVDYDQSGNELPLTYVLALDNRPKRTELKQQL